MSRSHVLLGKTMDPYNSFLESPYSLFTCPDSHYTGRRNNALLIVLSQGKALLHQVRISVMEDLLDIYTADNPVNCASLHFRTFAHRATEWQKYEDFPDVIRANEFAVDHSLDTTGFPFTSDSSTYHPSSVLRYPVRLWWPYHQAARALRRHMGYMLPHPLYVTQYTGACDTEPCLTKLAP